MKKIILMADSAMDLPQEIIDEEKIEIVPFVITIGGKEYRDGVNITTAELYKLVEQHKEMPKTSAITPFEWEKVFKKHLDNGDDVLLLTIGKEISSTYQYAYLASQSFPKERIEVIDSQALSGSIALIMLKAIRFRKEGKSLAEIKQLLAEIIPKVQTQFVLPTLEYLHKGGRCSALTRFVGTVLSLKLQIKMIDGVMDVSKKSVGKMTRAVDVMLADFFKLAEEDKLDLEFVFITHSLANKMAVYVKEKVLAANIPIKNLYESYASTTISTHCGPGTIGILYIEK